jgi:NAD(P)-dependent dehydrogenase (short-subunit alcohol dehydrogenase family)
VSGPESATIVFRRSESRVAQPIEQVATVLGGIDALINNAGEIVVGPLDAMGREDFKDALDIHFWAPFNVTFASLALLIQEPFRPNRQYRLFRRQSGLSTSSPLSHKQVCPRRVIR